MPSPPGLPEAVDFPGHSPPCASCGHVPNKWLVCHIMPVPVHGSRANSGQNLNFLGALWMSQVFLHLLFPHYLIIRAEIGHIHPLTL